MKIFGRTLFSDRSNKKPLPGNVFLVISGVLFIIILVTTVLTLMVSNNAVRDAEASVRHVQEQLDQETRDNAQKIQVLKQESTGIEASRRERDDQKMSAIMAKAGTWDSNDEYSAARTSLMRDYDIKADSEFMREFMPETTCTMDTSGNKYCEIDTSHLNSSFKSLDTQVVTKVAGNVTYFGLARMQVSANNGGTTTRYSAVEYTTDVGGNILSLKPFAATSAPVFSNN